MGEDFSISKGRSDLDISKKNSLEDHSDQIKQIII